MLFIRKQLMKPSARGETAAAITRAKGKMFEYRVPLEEHIAIPKEIILEQQFSPAIATLGDYAAEYICKYLGVEPWTATATDELKFYSRTLAAYAETRRADELSPEIILLSAAGYYLAGMPGNSRVMLRRISNFAEPSFSVSLNALRRMLDKPWDDAPHTDTHAAYKICSHTRSCLSGNISFQSLLAHIKEYRAASYESAPATDLLATDLLCATAICRVENSARYGLPDYSGVSADLWEPYLVKSGSLKELWPSQRLLGDAGVYSGKSAIVQMPTSAGKTKAIELVIRSSFISKRTRLAIIVAPYRALCQEITNALTQEFEEDSYTINQLTDSIQPEYLEGFFEFMEPLEEITDPVCNVIVVTPEKLLYVLRQRPELVKEIGLIIYDEGHQFDTGKRGVTYELLLTSIRQVVRDTAQIVLISAVIQNPAALASWLLPESGSVVSDNGAQTERSLAFASWKETLGQLIFHDLVSLEETFFVPRVLSEEILTLRGRERATRTFPNKGDGSSVALYLATKLIENGAAAIFCGTKPSVSKLIRDGLDVFSRNPISLAPANYANQDELSSLVKLYAANFGNECYLTEASKLGMFGHHGDTPHGLRLAIEHAIRTGLIPLVVCTSTLAQGVNLPIRYLLVTGTRQGSHPIRTRDFHNLMGRAGRAGIHGEGTVIFTDPNLFDQKTKRDGYWRWREITNILRPENTEPTSSTLLTVLSPVLSFDQSKKISTTALELVVALVTRRDVILAWAENPPVETIDQGFPAGVLSAQIEERLEIIRSIESFLMSQREETSTDEFVKLSREISKQTFAYSLADQTQKIALEEIFGTIASHIESRVPDIADQRRYGRTLLGVDESIEVDRWAGSNIENLLECESRSDLLHGVWPMLQLYSNSKRVKQARPEGAVLSLATMWIEGNSYGDIFQCAEDLGIEYPHGSQWRKYTIDDLVGLCEQSFGYDQQLLIATLAESFLKRADSYGEQGTNLYNRVCSLQKNLKYGLASENQIRFYEGGFSERVVAIGLAGHVRGQIASSSAFKQFIKANKDYFANAVSEYPAYFRSVLAAIINS